MSSLNGFQLLLDNISIKHWLCYLLVCLHEPAYQIYIM